MRKRAGHPGPRMRLERRGRGLTQEAVSERAGLHRIALSLWESGRCLLSRPQVRDIRCAIEALANEREEEVNR